MPAAMYARSRNGARRITSRVRPRPTWTPADILITHETTKPPWWDKIIGRALLSIMIFCLPFMAVAFGLAVYVMARDFVRLMGSLL